MGTDNKVYHEYSNPYDRVQLNWSCYLDLWSMHLSFLEDMDVILDAGTGTGNQAAELANDGKIVYAFDTNESMMKYVHPKVEEDKADNLHLMTKDMENMDFPSGFFDAVTAMNVVYNLSNPVKAMEEAYRVTKEGGLFLMSGPTHWADGDLIADHAVAEMKEKGLYDAEMAKNLEIMRKLNKEALISRATKYDTNELEDILTKNIGFREVIYSNEKHYLGTAYFVAAKK